MPLTKRIIPYLVVKDGKVVKGIKLLNLREAGDPVEQAAYYNQQGVDELFFLDIILSHNWLNIKKDRYNKIIKYLK